MALRILRVPQLVAASLALAAAGCGGGVGNLSGKVTFNGKPVTSGTVQVFLTDGSTKTSDISNDGSYRINDVPAGTVKIGVSSPNPQQRYNDLVAMAKTEEQKKAIQVPDPALLKSWVALPNELAQSGTSNLTATVNKGENPHDLALTGVSPTSNTTSAPPPPPRGSARP